MPQQVIHCTDFPFFAQYTECYFCIKLKEVYLRHECVLALLDLAVGFSERSLELSEDPGSSTATVCVVVQQGNIGQSLSLLVTVAGGSAEGKLTV